MRRSASALLFAALSVGCGPVVYGAAPEQPAVYVIATPAATEPVEPGADDAATNGESPFQVGETWSGTYLCAQGKTDLRLIVFQAGDDRLRAIFDFSHGPTGVKGSYLLDGSFDPETRQVSFRPGAWIVKPPNYVTVGMEGEVSSDDEKITGRITHPSCGEFRVVRDQ